MVYSKVFLIQGGVILKEISNEELNQIVGGTDITAPIINALTNVFKVLYDAGSGLGSAIRRITSNNMCPTK